MAMRGKNPTHGGDPDTASEEKGAKTDLGVKLAGREVRPASVRAPPMRLGAAGCAQGDFLEAVGAGFRAHGAGRKWSR